LDDQRHDDLLSAGDFLERPKLYKAGCGSPSAPQTIEDAMTRPLLAALALALPLAGVIPALGQEAGAAAAGRKLALKVCASCHVVSADQARAPVLKPPAPSFSQIAARPDLTEASVRGFLAEAHGHARRNSAMPAFLLPGSQIDAVVAYFLSLKPQ
jgi:mono/diheme cytochrome c family protein